MSEPTEKLIYWRKSSDVSNRNRIGEYRAEDLNRVESWCRYLADEINTAGYNIVITTKTNWTQSDLRDHYNMERIRQNILKIMNGFHWITPIYNTVNGWNWNLANRWEQILSEIYNMMFGMQNWYVYSGVSRSGQPRLYQHRFREFFEQLDLNVDWQYINTYYRERWNEFNSSDTWQSIS